MSVTPTPSADAPSRANLTVYAPACCDVPLVGMAISEVGSTQWVEVNATLAELLGYTREELIALRWHDLTHPDDQAMSIGMMQRAMRGDLEHYRIVKRYLRKDGTVVHAILHVRPLRDAGVVRWLQASIVDISDQVRAQEEAREAQQLLQRLTDHVPGILYEFEMRPDGQMRVPFASRGLSSLLGLPDGAFRNDATEFFRHVVSEDVAELLASIRSSAAQLAPWSREFRVHSVDGTQHWLRGEARPERHVGAVTRWYGVLSDVTDMHAQQDALASSEQQLRYLFEHAAEGILVLDADTRAYVDVNPVALSMLGYARESIIGKDATALSADVQPEGRAPGELFAKALAAVQAGHSFTTEWNARHAAGHVVPCELRITLLPMAGRRLLRGAIVDISARVRARDDVERLQQAIDSSVTGVAMADTTGQLTFVNRAFLALWGYEREEDVLGRSAISFWRTPEEAQVVIASLADHGGWTGELTAARRDGTQRTVQLNASAIRDGYGAMVGMLASFSDITETKRLEQELNQSQKLESIGRLAGGVAHDFNNLLTVIKASLDLAYGELPPDSMARVDLREVSRAADSAARLTQQLLAFSRKQPIAPTTLNLNDVVHRVSAMMQRLLGEDIRLRTVTAHDLGYVHFDAGQGEQVLVNLAVNARDAMPRGGSLTIETSNVHLDADFVRVHQGVHPDDYVMLTVTDTGVGMTDEVLAHAFEPFFTTKAAGKGTGLGLAVIHGAVVQNGGRIDVTSAVGKGTTFRIYLPRVAAPATEDELEHPAPLPRGSEVILLVEDDVAVRQLMTRLLVQQGYRVFAFGDGEKAVQWLDTTTEPVQLLLTDVIMPGMNGKELADAVAVRRPGMRVLYASGYTANVIAQHGVLDAAIPFLPKPFAVRELALTVRDALDRD